MEILQGIFYNTIWIIGWIVTSFILTWVFKFVPLPHWLEFGIIFVLSLLSGLILMAVFVRKSIGDSWRQCWAELDFLFVLAIPIVAACIVAVIAHLILNPYIKDQELQQWAVWFIAGVFWCFAISWVAKYFKGKLKN